MFGTVIIDAYKKQDTLDIAKALEDLCNPNDSYGWASAGIYCFWDYNIHEVLYIGLASDLSERFKQHNGLLPIGDECCKRSYIEDYFKEHEKLGYTIFVQSSLSQPLTHKNKKKYKKIAEQSGAPVENMLSEQGRDDIKRVEGILIESYRNSYGRFPVWNKVGGSVEGQQKIMKNNINIVRSFCNPDQYEVNPIVSRSTLRELSNSPDYAAFESFFHAVRMYMLIFGMEYNEALEFANTHDDFGWYKHIIEAGYNNKKLVV